MRKIFNRLYTDYIQTNRIDDYHRIIESALENNYEIHSVPSFYEILKNNGIEDNKKYLVVRHDLDTNAKYALQFDKIEKLYNLSTSYYFRLSTANIPVMKHLHQNNHDVGYHYEEISSAAKVNRYKTTDEIYANISKIKELFTENLMRLRKETGIPINSVVSHGDFVNRKLGIKNFHLLKDERFRKENNIELEANDIFKINNFSEVRDNFYPKYYSPHSPKELIEKGCKTIHFLSHPRYWKASPLENTVDNLKRIYEEIRYKQ